MPDLPPSEILAIDLNKTKFESMPKDLQSIMKWSIIAASADGEWNQMAKNADDYAKLLARGIKFIVTPQSVRDNQLKAWDTVNAAESKAELSTSPTTCPGTHMGVRAGWKCPH